MAIAVPTDEEVGKYGGQPNLAGGYLGVGAPGYLITGLEAAKGIPAASMPYHVPESTNTIGASFDVLRKSVFYGSRMAEQVIRVLKGKVAGGITHSFFADAAAPFVYVGLGKEVWLAPITDVSTATATDALGQTTLPVANGLQYTKGALLQVGTPPFTEAVSVASVSSGAITVKLLRASTGRATAMPITQLGQHKFTLRGPLDAAAFDLPTMTLERNMGRQYAWQLAGSRVAKFDIKAGKEDAELTHTMVCTVDPVRLDPPGGGVTNPYTVFSPSQAERRELVRPLTIRDGYAMVPNDQAASGNSLLSRLAELEEWNVSWDNHFIDKDFWNDHRIKDSFPGTTKGMVTYKYSTSAGRPSEYEDYLAVEGAPPVEFFVTMAVNMGNPTTPVWHGASIYVPAMLITKTDNPESMTDLLASNVEAEIVTDDLGSDPLQIFMANSITGAYPAT